MFSLLDRLSASSGGAQEFIDSGTFIVPEGVYKIWVTACGGGASGSSYGGNSTYGYPGGAGGNGGEAIVKKPFNVSPGEIINITIGAGGASVSSGIGKAGGNTIIGNLVTLLGGPAPAGTISPNDVCREGAGRGGKGYQNGEGGDGEDGIMGKGGRGAGRAWCYYYDSSFTTNVYADTGVLWINDNSEAAGGGGGSLGNGGNGACYKYLGYFDSKTNYKYYKATAGTKGGGGGGGYYMSTGTSSDGNLVTYYASGAGGKGYCLIEW